VQSIQLSSTSSVIFVDQTYRVTSTISPLSAAGTQLRITSDNTRVARVDQNGTITGVSPGTATITFRAPNGVTATHQVIVVDPDISPELLEALAEALESGTDGEIEVLAAQIFGPWALLLNAFGPLRFLAELILWPLLWLVNPPTFTRQVELQNVSKYRWNPFRSRMIPQGFAVGATFAYSFEVDENDTYHYLYQYHMDDGTLTQMTVRSGRTVGPLGHANDMALVTINNTNYIFVVAHAERDGTNLTEPAIVRLRRIGSTYYEYRRYPTEDNFTGITSLGHVSTNNGPNNAVQFLVKRGARFFTVTIRYDLAGGTTITPVERFRLNEAPYHLGAGHDATNWVRQGIHYRSGSLFVPLWNGRGNQNENVILRYNITRTHLTNTFAPSQPLLSHVGNPWILNGAAGSKFEIEGVGIRNSTGVLWFNTYEGTSTNGGIYTATRRP